MNRGLSLCVSVASIALMLLGGRLACIAQASPLATGQLSGIERWFTVSANIDGGYRWTQFFEPHYDTWVGGGDSRFELWLPPNDERHLWGPYVRFAAIIGTKRDAWQNGALARPGAGLQIYPFSFKGRFKFLDPVRVFGEYNFMHYWADNPGGWRPRHQARAGVEYWKAVNVNDTSHYWWLETWDGAFFQSANEFTKQESTPIIANTLRFGFRRPNKGLVSVFTPYAALESAWDKYERTGQCFLTNPDQQISQNPQNPCDFYWENRFLGGGGLRIAPPLGKIPNWLLNRFVIYGEYLSIATYYGPSAPSSVPSHDWRVGLSASLGKWYK